MSDLVIADQAAENAALRAGLLRYRLWFHVTRDIAIRKTRECDRLRDENLSLRDEARRLREDLLLAAAEASR